MPTQVHTLEMIQWFHMENCKLVSTLIKPDKWLSTDMCPKNNEECTHIKNIPYLKAIESIMYLAITTQLDVAYAAETLARFGSNPTLENWTAVNHCHLPKPSILPPSKPEERSAGCKNYCWKWVSEVMHHQVCILTTSQLSRWPRIWSTMVE